MEEPKGKLAVSHIMFKFSKYLIFKFTERCIALSKEVSGSCCRIKESKVGNFLLKSL